MRATAGLALLPMLLGCAEKIGRAELLAQIQSETPPSIVDVRSRDEFATSHVPGAVHIPFHSMPGSETELPGASDAPLVLYCEHGPRAGLARARLWFVTDRPIRFLEGHMTAWKEAGLPVEAGSLPPE